MASEPANLSSALPVKGPDVQPLADTGKDNSADSSPVFPVNGPDSHTLSDSTEYTAGHDAPLIVSPSSTPSSGISSLERNLRIPQPLTIAPEDSQTGNDGKSDFARFTSGFGFPLSPIVSTSVSNENAENNYDDKTLNIPRQDKSASDAPSMLSPSGIASWARGIKIPQTFTIAQEDLHGKSNFARFTDGLGLRLSPKVSVPDENVENNSDVQTLTVPRQDKSDGETPSILSSSGISSWARSLRTPQPVAIGQEDSQTGNDVKSNFARFTNGLGLRLSPKDSTPNEISENNSTTSETGVLGSLRKGLVDSSRSAVKAVQVKARHIVSQNKRRYQEGGFDLDMSYITENIIAMGFPAGDISSGIFGYIEGFYRNHMEEVIEFFETNHKGKYKVYNLCSERLYDASLFKGKVASFPFDDHNCPPIQLILSFCQSAYSWLKEDTENVVVVHCKDGMARTGLMVSSLLLFVKFFSTAEESIDYFNQKRCLDGKGLFLPSQIRYVKYFEHILTRLDGEIPFARRCMLRGFRLHKCPFWIRPSITVSNHKGVLFTTKEHPKTKNLMPEDFWISAPKKGITVFALPGERGLTELTGDFEIHFHDRQGDFYCWLNTTMTENRITLNTSDLDGFDKRSVPSPGFQIDVVMIDYDGTIPTRSKTETTSKGSGTLALNHGTALTSRKSKGSAEEDDVFSDTESEGSSRRRHSQTILHSAPATCTTIDPKSGVKREEMTAVMHATERVSLKSNGPARIPVSESMTKATSLPAGSLGDQKLDSKEVSDIKAIAADASVFSFGDEEDFESE